MNPFNRSNKKVKLAKQQASIALSVTLSIGLVLALVQVLIDYRNEEDSLDRQVHQLISSASNSASEAIWSLDKDLSDGIANGILSHPLVRQVSIVTSNNVVMSEQTIDEPTEEGWSDRFTFLFGAIRVKDVDLYHLKNQTGEPIGVLTIVVDPMFVQQQFSNRVLIILFSGLSKALILGVVLFFLFYFTLTKPIERYAQWVSNIDPKNPDGWAHTPPERKQNDELREFGDEAASRFKQAREHFIELKEKRAELLELNKGLEHRVLQRTQELEKSLALSDRLAKTDDLTGLANRRSFMEQAQSRHAEWIRYKRTYALLMIDIDNFKKINDQYGHAVGDKVLVAVASILKQFTRKENVVGRLGGEEFCILMVGVNEEEAVKLAERMRQTLEGTSITIDDNYFEITASFGLLPPNLLQDDFEAGLKSADTMLYLAKNQGRNQVCVFSEQRK